MCFYLICGSKQQKLKCTVHIIDLLFKPQLRIIASPLWYMFKLVCALKLSTVSQRFLGNLCMTSWTRSWSLTSAYQRASFSSTPWSGRDRCGFFFTWHLYTYFISNLASTKPFSALFQTGTFDINSFLSCYSAVCRRLAPWPSPAHCVHLLCCWRSSRFQHYCNAHPEIVSYRIQNLCVFNLIHV